VISPVAKLLPDKYNSVKKFHPGVIKFGVTLQKWKKIQYILVRASNTKFHENPFILVSVFRCSKEGR
jgi:hypothetical protein